MKPDTPATEKQTVIALWLADMPQKAIAPATNLGGRTVSRIIAEYKQIAATGTAEEILGNHELLHACNLAHYHLAKKHD